MAVNPAAFKLRHEQGDPKVTIAKREEKVAKDGED